MMKQNKNKVKPPLIGLFINPDLTAAYSMLKILLMKRIKQGFRAAVAGAGLALLSACGTVPTETQEPENNARRLTAGERLLAQEVYNDAINYDRLFIKRGTTKETRSKALNGRIIMTKEHYRDDYSKSKNEYIVSLFFHEMAHIWQQQQGISPVRHAIRNFFKYGLDDSPAYKYKRSDLDNFENLS